MSRLISSISVSSSSCFRFRSSNLSNFSCIRSLASPSPAPAMYNCVFSRVIQGIFRVNGLNEFKDSVKDVEFVVSGNQCSVATKIENGPKTNTKILWFLKMDRRRIRRIFVNSKILRRSSKIANSSNIFEDTKIFKGKWKIFVVKIFFQAAT